MVALNDGPFSSYGSLEFGAEGRGRRRGRGGIGQKYSGGHHFRVQLDLAEDSGDYFFSP